MSSTSLPLSAAYAPPDHAADAARSGTRGRQALALLKLALVASCFLGVGNYSPAIVPPELGALTQVFSILMWVLIAAASFGVPPRLHLGPWTDLALGLAFYAFAILSVLWSDLLAASFLKSGALLVTTFAAYRLARSLSLDEIVGCVLAGLAILCTASVATVLVLPEIGIVQTGMHEGQWSGLFESKQSLGAVGALVIFFAGYRLMTRRRWLPFLLTVSVALACVVGSGSRGAGATAVAAILFLYVVQGSPRLGRLMAFGPVAMTLVACALLGHLYATDGHYFVVFGEPIDLTQRTFIWHHALERFDANPLLGYGLNGFWSVDTILHAFMREHGWVLDNYHSGYLAILTETGLVGMALYLAWIFMFGARMARWIGRDALPPAHLNLIVAYMNLIFFFNVTETFFLRSTNLMAVMMAAFFFVSAQALDRRRAA